jgi:hypothetical protein
MVGVGVLCSCHVSLGRGVLYVVWGTGCMCAMHCVCVVSTLSALCGRERGGALVLSLVCVSVCECDFLCDEAFVGSRARQWQGRCVHLHSPISPCGLWVLNGCMLPWKRKSSSE